LVSKLPSPGLEPLSCFSKKRKVARKPQSWNRSIALSVAVDADARRICQALTEPEYLETWVLMPNQADDSRIVASRTSDGYRLDQVCAGLSIATLVGSFLFCHQRKMRIIWRKGTAHDGSQSLVDLRVRGNFASSILELRHTALPSAAELNWHQQFWRKSLVRLASLMRHK
jgi:hypothetical protein